ncbi:MAG: SGNH/GDSL hydrolase family protein [Streptosporangiaceae bacterium]
MGEAVIRVSRAVALAVAPVILVQGRRVRRATPVLPEAAGLREGIEGTAERDAELSLLVLGESTAAGVGVGSQADGLGGQTAAALAARTGRAVRWQVAARTGTTAGQAQARLTTSLGDDSYDVIAIALGVNDVLRLTSRARWERGITALVSVLRPRLRAGGRIVLCGVPDLAMFPALPRPLRTVLGRHSRNLDRGLARVAAVSAATVHMPLPSLAKRDWWADDRFHPNAAGYRQWAMHVAAAVVPSHP